MTYREIEFIPAEWVERAAYWPGLQVHSRTIRVPADCPQRRKGDSVDKIERLLLDMEDLLTDI